MDCKGCKNLLDNECKLGKHELLGVLRNDNREVIQLNETCIFKNTVHDFTFDMAHKFAMAKVAVATYFIIRNEDDIQELYNLLDNEKNYGETNLIGQFNVLSTIELSVKQVGEISLKLVALNKNRFWTFKILYEDTPERYIINNCELPYFLHILSESDLAMIQNFKYICFSGKIPNVYGNIISTKWFINKVEKIEENAGLQTKSLV